MAKPLNSSLRSAILDAFNTQPICSINNVVDHLKSNGYEDYSYYSARRMMLKMVKEHLLLVIPGRDSNNTKFFAKVSWGTHGTRFLGWNNENVSLKGFIHTTVPIESELIDSNALKAIKVWMLDVLGNSIPDAYEGHPPVDEIELKKRLKKTAEMLSHMHKFVKAFIEADVWSPVAKERLAQEFNSTCIEEHAAIVDRTWIKKDETT